MQGSANVSEKIRRNTSVKPQVHVWHLGRLGQDVKDAQDGFLPKTIHLG
jgi:hypothetical protein